LSPKEGLSGHFCDGANLALGQYHSIFDPVLTKTEAEFLLKRNLIVAA
jgi:hypothetical protein